MRTRPHRTPDVPPVDSQGAKLRPLGARLVIRRLKVAEKSAGGIIVNPHAKSEKSDRGEVLAVGPGRLLEDGTIRPIDARVGDIAVFGLYQRNEIKIDGEDLLVVHEDDLLAVEDPADLSEEAKAGLAATYGDDKGERAA